VQITSPSRSEAPTPCEKIQVDWLEIQTVSAWNNI
jgi:hypothetical protein